MPMELNNILSQSNQIIRVSWHGAESSFKLCEPHLLAAFSHTAIPWRKAGTQYPSHILIPIRFVSFSRELIAISDFSPKEKLESAFVHLYFFDISTPEEYKTLIRPSISECTKAREKKCRGPVLERLKSDFSKHVHRLKSDFSKNVHRLIEVQQPINTSTFTVLIAQMQQYLLNAIDSFIVSNENLIQTSKEKYRNLDWDPLIYINHQTVVSRLYWTLGLLDQVLAQLDEIEALLVLLVMQPMENWSDWLKGTAKIVPIKCPSIGLAMQKPFCESGSLLELRTWIIATQLLVNLNLFNQRSRLAAANAALLPTGENRTVSYNATFASLILRYSAKCIASVNEQIAILQIDMDRLHRSTYTALFCLEVFDICTLLMEPAHVESASSFICSLWIFLCNALTRLGAVHEDKNGGAESLLKWLPSPDPDQNHTESSLSRLRTMISQESSHAHFMQKYHESAMAILKHFNWKRHSRLIGRQLADFLVRSDRLEGALPYYVKLLNNFWKEGWKNLLVHTLLEVIDHFEQRPDVYLKQLVEYTFILAVDAPQIEQRQYFGERLLRLLSSDAVPEIRFVGIRGIPSQPFALSISRLQTSAVPNTQLTVEMELFSRFAVSIAQYRIRLVFVETIDREENSQVYGQSHTFQCSYNATEGVSRFSLVPSSKYSPTRSHTEKMKENAMIFCGDDKENPVIRIGANRLNLTAKADRSGVFLLNFLELSIGMGVFYLEDFDFKGQKSTITVREMEPSIRLLDAERELTGGVSEKIEVELDCGTSPILEESQLLITGVDGNSIIEFQLADNSWASQRSIRISPFVGNSSERVRVSLVLCALLDSVCSNGDVFHTKVKLEWHGTTWFLPLHFRPVFNIQCSTSLLEDKVLLEVDVQRHPCGGNGRRVRVVPSSAILLQSRNPNEAPNVPAKLLNSHLQVMMPNSQHRLVWILPNVKGNSRGVLLEHRLEMEYRVEWIDEESNGRSTTGRLHRFVEHLPIYLNKILSEHPQAVLCRAGSPCELVVSLRSLTNRVETLIIVVDADQQHWSLPQRHKFLFVKESGLGQINFSITPRQVGYLPYPSICVHSCTPIGVQEKSQPSLEMTDFGVKLNCFVRTNGRQMHVLSPLAIMEKSPIKGAEKQSNNSPALKQRLTKIFE